jgi:hypothetical protein
MAKQTKAKTEKTKDTWLTNVKFQACQQEEPK